MKIKILRLICLFFPLFLFVISANIIVKGSDTPTIELQGKVKSLKLNSNDKHYISFDLTVEMSFINKSTSTILLSKRKPWEFYEYIGSSIENLSDRKYIYRAGRGAANDISPKWEKYRKELDQLAPPQEHFRYILPNEDWRFEIETVIEIKKVLGIESDSLNKIDWTEIKSFPELWLELDVNFWFSNIEIPENRKEKRFGKKLRNQWSKFGYLWLDDIVSEPIQLDLSSAFARTESQ